MTGLLDHFIVFGWVSMLELLYVAWIQAIEARRALAAAVYSGAVACLGIASVVAVVGNSWLLISVVLGHMVGSYVGVKLDGDEDNDSEGPGGEASADGGGPGDTWRLLSHYGQAAPLSVGGRPVSKVTVRGSVSAGSDQRRTEGDGPVGSSPSQVHTRILRNGVSEDWPSGVDL